MNGENRTLEYYQQHADEFISDTVSVDMQEIRTRFCAGLPAGALILDFGCGSGRDTKAFLEAGYRVEAVDGSEELARKASQYTGIPVKQMLFQELDAVSRYDGIWASASILHLPMEELTDVIRKIAAALRPKGVLYTSFKYGEAEETRGGRYFTDFTKEKLEEYWKQFPSLRIFDYWITRDTRPGREDLRWNNLLARRVQGPGT